MGSPRRPDRVGPDVSYGQVGHGRVRERPAGRRRPRLRLPARHPGAPPPEARRRPLPACGQAVRPPDPAAGQRPARSRDLPKPTSQPQFARPPERRPDRPAHEHSSTGRGRDRPNTRQAPHHQDRQHPPPTNPPWAKTTPASRTMPHHPHRHLPPTRHRVPHPQPTPPHQGWTRRREGRPTAVETPGQGASAQKAHTRLRRLISLGRPSEPRLRRYAWLPRLRSPSCIRERPRPGWSCLGRSPTRTRSRKPAGQDSCTAGSRRLRVGLGLLAACWRVRAAGCFRGCGL